jgi:hypothetical protein
MGYTVTSNRRRLAMATLLVLAASGGVIRYYAPNPSTLRDIGTLLLVLWLPAVGNFIGYLRTKMPGPAPIVIDFSAGTAFTAQLEVQIDSTGASAELLAALDPTEQQCTLLVARHGFTARAQGPLAPLLATPGPQTLPLELLHPKVALRTLEPGTEFHLVVGAAGLAKGTVLRVLAPAA